MPLFSRVLQCLKPTCGCSFEARLRRYGAAVSNSRRIPATIAAVPFAIATFLRVYGLSDYFLSPDDLLHLEIASGATLSDVWANGSEQMHPPLVFFLLHYVLELTNNHEVLRHMALVPGLALLVGSYHLGRSVSGVTCAVVMVFAAALGYAPVILSQIIRPYCLLALLLSVAFAAYVSFATNARRRDLVLYSVTISLSCLLHYSAAIPFVAITVVWAWRVRRGGRAAFVPLMLGSVVPASILAVFYWVHIRKLSGLRDAVHQSYLVRQFATDPLVLLDNVHGLFGFFFFDANASLAMVLFAVGIFALWQAGHKEAASVIVVVFVLSIALNIAGQYPFGAMRQSFYLLPFVLLAVGAGVQHLFDLVRAEIRWSKRHTIASIAVAAMFFTWFLAYAARFDWIRLHPNSDRYGVFEFPVRRAGYEQLTGQLRRQVGSDDVVLGTRQASHYFRYATRYDPRALAHPMPSLMTIDIPMGRVFATTKYLNFGSGSELSDALRDLETVVDLSKVPRIWLVNIGWGLPIATVGEQDPGFAKLFREAGNLQSGGSIAALEGPAVSHYLRAQRGEK
ncbi:MAG: hypothetical protein H6832_18950 [Planctomycetes bacterium]|nr:hypothetical protein [Planctomycetota bacterium]MCB9920489.1 hypothetical protein [Planctomycetota bacterium]